MDLEQKHWFFPCKFAVLLFAAWDTKEIYNLRINHYKPKNLRICVPTFANYIISESSVIHREIAGVLLGFWPMPSLCNKAHGGVLCTFITRTSATEADLQDARRLAAPNQVWRYGPSGKTAWSVHHNTNLTRLRQPPTASHGASVLGHLSSLRPHWFIIIQNFQLVNFDEITQNYCFHENS